MVRKNGNSLRYKQNENRFQSDLFKFAKGLGFRYSHFPDSTRATTRGIPDVLFLHDELGIAFWAELKTDDGKLSKYQVATNRTLRRAGHVVYEWWPQDWDDGIIEKVFVDANKEAERRV